MTQYSAQSFPSRFGALEQYSDFARESELDRAETINARPFGEIVAFYDAMLPLLPEALDYLNTFDVKALPREEANLLRLCLAMVEASMAVELFEDTDPKYLMPIRRFFPEHDKWAKDAAKRAGATA
ncbi:hypothetical protein [Sphingomonas sp.]|uniref:hypothetical protein n=1 Tax=Sphingomonas sp. TaxID=28214 RepID=UPI002FC9F8F7